MSRLPLLVGVTALVLLAGCRGEPTASNAVAVVETNNDVLANDGGGGTPSSNITLAGDGLGKASFDMTRDVAVARVEEVLGPRIGQGTNPECGAGPLENVDFPGGLTLFFQDGKFVGWSVDGRDGSPYRTEAGIRIGSTLQKLRDAGDVAVQDTSLGVEFKAGDLGGLATANRPDGKVTNLWAGTTCVFR